MKLVVIESPFTGHIERNTAYARDAMADSLSRGEAPIASHLLYTQPGILDAAKPDERERGIEAGLRWSRVGELTAVYTDLGMTAGMEQRLERAVADGRQVELRSLPNWAVEV